jgi:hemoglobin
MPAMTPVLPDLVDRAGIERLVNAFYDRIRKDTVLGPIFSAVDWALHLPKMYRFWESVLFRAGSYQGNPIAAHARLISRAGMTKAHFDHWLAVFRETVNDLFAGENASHIQRSAEDMACVIYSKIHQLPDPRFDPANLTEEQRLRYAAYRAK